MTHKAPAMVTKPETSVHTSACCQAGITIACIGRLPTLSSGGSPSSSTAIRLSSLRCLLSERRQALGLRPSLPLTSHEYSAKP